MSEEPRNPTNLIRTMWFAEWLRSVDELTDAEVRQLKIRLAIRETAGQPK